MCYVRLSIAERELIHKGLILGKGNNEIARELGRHPSTISREVRRMGLPKDQYSPILANALSNRLKSSRRANKKKIGDKLAAFIEEYLIKKRFSPEQISHDLRKRFPKDSSLHISHEAIYQYIYQLKELEKRKRLIKCLRRRKKQRRKRCLERDKRGKIPNMTSIHERPEAVNNREEIGHWEGDLVIGKGHKTAILTLVERVSRYTVIVHLGSDMTSDNVVRACELGLAAFPSELKKSITYDRGKEMSRHEQLTQSTGIKVYFADPHAPWQRGTNENTNGLIRDFFPKGTDFSLHNIEEVKRVEMLLNLRPRKTLGFEAPVDLLNQYLAGSTSGMITI